jgi:hypothetical protein
MHLQTKAYFPRTRDINLVLVQIGVFFQSLPFLYRLKAGTEKMVKQKIMKQNILVFLVVSIGFVISACDKKDDGPDINGNNNGNNDTIIKYDPVAVTKSNAVKLYVHYMPWFETKETSDNGAWGQHWTMATRNPDITDEDGKRQIASYYYPLIGPYASSDKDVIEYHLLLMKYIGADGILVDWYGTIDLYDYPLILKNSEALIDMLDEVGLEFAVVYEDRTITTAFENSAIDDIIAAAKADMAYMQSYYFNEKEYIKINDKPLLLNFGPETFHTETEWTQIFQNLNPKPCFLMLWYTSAQGGSNASGEYSWVYEDNSHLTNFYVLRLPNIDVALGGAYPGFRDFYAEGGWGTGMGWQINHNDGETFEETLDISANADIDYLQLITWNDFGEGTMIEPTLEFGFTLLEKVQSFSGVSYDTTELKSIYNLYNLRKQYKDDNQKQKILDQTFYYFVSLQVEKANHLLDSIQTVQ